jgi:membrane protein
MATQAPTRRERIKARQEALQRRRTQLAERAQVERTRHDSVDAVFAVVDRDAEVGGGIIAGALAYRFFFWSLPLALVFVSGLGLVGDASSTSPEKAAKSLGMAGLISSSVSSTANSSARWYALLVGIPLLLIATRSVLRVLIGTHRLAWGDVRERAPKPTPAATLRLLGLFLAYLVVAGAAGAARNASPGPGVLVALLAVVPFAGFWLLVSMRLPHGDADWKGLIPGALLFGVGIELVHLVTVYFIAPYSIEKQGTYGALGAAAALLLGLFIAARLVVGAAVLNAALWERQRPRRGERSTE